MADMIDSGNDDGHVRQSEWQRLLEEYKPVAWIVVVSVLAFFLVLGLIPHVLKCIGIVSEAGTFGDSFGFVNAFFSGFAVAGLLVTIWIQIREFHLAQLERKDSIDTQKKTSVQQYFTGIVTAISTWTEWHGNRRLPGYSEMRLEHFRFLERKQSNEVLLDLASDYLLSESINAGDRDIIVKFQNDPKRLMLIRDQAHVSKIVKISLEHLSMLWHLLHSVPSDAKISIAWVRTMMNGTLIPAVHKLKELSTEIKQHEESTVSKLCDKLCQSIDMTISAINGPEALIGTSPELQDEGQNAKNELKLCTEIVFEVIVDWYSEGYPSLTFADI